MEEHIIIPDHIKKLISGYLSDSLNPEELSVLKNWITESPENRKHFNEMRHTWAFAGQNISTAEQQTKLLALIDKVSAKNRKTPQTFWTWQRIAASWVIIFICAGAMGWFMNDREKKGNKYTTVTDLTTTVYAKLGSQSTVEMPDGSKVWLNGGSKISYNESYGATDREVQLTGEAYFDVVTNPQKPFIVKAGILSIKALGTSFNVKAYPEDQMITTTLVKGKVVLEGRDENNKEFSLTLKPNENVTYKTHLSTFAEVENIHQETDNIWETEDENVLPDPIIMETNVKSELYTSWKDDSWIIERQKLGDLAKDFERRYNVHILFSSEKIRNYHFSGTIQQETMEQVMSILRRTIPLQYSFNKNEIVIGEDKALSREFEKRNR